MYHYAYPHHHILYCVDLRKPVTKEYLGFNTYRVSVPYACDLIVLDQEEKVLELHNILADEAEVIEIDKKTTFFRLAVFKEETLRALAEIMIGWAMEGKQ